MSKKKIFFSFICINLFIILIAGLKINHEVQEEIIFQDSYTGNKWLKLDADDVASGVYRVNVWYDTNRTECTISMETGKKKYQLLQGDQWSLKPDKNELSFNIWLNHKTDTLSAIVDCGDVAKEDTFLNLYKISIARSRLGSLTYGLLKVLLALGIFDFIILFILRYDWLKKNYYVLISLITITIISSFGIMMNPLPSGHDLPFHLSRIWGIGQGLATGEFPVKIQPGWCNGYGYPVSIFYGDMLLYIPAVLTLLKVPLYTAYKAYVVMINLGTVLTSFFCFKKISGSKKVGVVCSAVYTLSVYRICNVFLRAAVGEYTAMMFIPLIIVGMWVILSEDVEQKDYQSKWVWLCLGITGLIQSHVLSCEMVGIFLVIICIVYIKRVFRKPTLIVLIKSVAATIFLNAGFLISFFDYAREKLNVFTEQEFYGIQKYGMSIYELFSINSTGSGTVIYADNNLGIRMPVTLGFTAILAFLLAVTVLVKNQDITRKEKKNLFIVLILTAVAVWFASDIFPWDRLDGIKGLKQITGTLQFPFRYMAIATGLITLMLSITLKICCKSEKNKNHIYLLLTVFLMGCIWQGMEYMDHVIRENGSTIVCDGTALNSSASSIYGGEYLYVGTDYEKAANDGNVYSEAEISAIERSGNRFMISCSTEKDTYLKIPLFYYPDYQCIDVDSKQKLPVIKGDNNELWVKVHAGYSGTLNIKFVEPWSWRIAEICSLLMLLVLIGYSLVNVRMKK